MLDMITISSVKRHTATSSNTAADYDFKGLSTDTKPTENIAVNSLFFELDTTDFYYFDGTDWELVVSSGGGGSIPVPVTISNGGTGGTTAAAARTNLNLYSTVEIDTLLDGKADTTDIPTDLNQLSNTTTKYVNETQLQNAIESLGSVFTLKGSVSTVNDLPNTGNTVGDVYYVESVSGGYLWINDNGTLRWEALGTTIDTSDFLTKSGLLTTTGNATNNTMTQAAITTALNGKANTSDIPTKTSDLTNDSNFVASTSLAAVATSGSYADLSNTPTQLTDFSGTLPVNQGGTGTTSLTSGEILIGNGTSGITSVATLPIASGGTGGTTATAARTNLGVLTPVELYYNAAGNAGTITLNDDIANYKCIEITAKNYAGHLLGWRIWHNEASSFSACITINTPYANTVALSVQSRVIDISGTTLSWGNGIYAILKNNTNVSTAAEGSIAIIKITGYKF